MTKEYIEKHFFIDRKIVRRKEILKQGFTEELIYNKYYNTQTPNCPRCNEENFFITFNKGYSKYCSRKCSGKA